MKQAVQQVWNNPYSKVFVLLLGIVIAYFILGAVQPATTIFLVSFALAYLVAPLVGKLKSFKIPRALGVLIVFVALFGSLYVMALIAVRSLRNAFAVDEDGVAISDTVVNWLESLPATLEGFLPDSIYQLISTPLESLGDLLLQGAEALAPQLESIGAGVFLALSGTVSGVFQAVMIMIVTAYILYDYPRLSRALVEVVPVPFRARIAELGAHLDHAVGGFVRGQLVVATGVGVLVFVGLTIIGLPGAGFIGLLAGVLNIVPFLGSLIPPIPAVLLAISGGWVQVLLVLVVFLVANQIDNQILTPFILGRTTDLHPVTVILGVVGGFSLYGIVGGIVAVPAMAFIKTLYADYYQKSRLYREG